LAPRGVVSSGLGRNDIRTSEDSRGHLSSVCE
jgi:hypothetical protein